MIQVKFDALAEKYAIPIEKGDMKPEPVNLAPKKVDNEGDFSFVFNADLLGLSYLKPTQVILETQGKVSELFADEDGPITFEE